MYLSEGVNLQAGQVVINYDFHWNPVRLIQRAGRVDRIGSKHEVIKIINFLPDPTIEHDLHLESLVSGKIDEIQRVIGEDYKILKETENINEEDIYAIYRNQESILDKDDENNPPDLEKRIKNFIDNLKSRDSIVFFYLNFDNPVLFEDESKYVLVGCALLSDIKGPLRFNFTQDELKSYTRNPRYRFFPTINWAFQVSLRLRKEWYYFTIS